MLWLKAAVILLFQFICVRIRDLETNQLGSFGLGIFHVLMVTDLDLSVNFLLLTPDFTNHHTLLIRTSSLETVESKHALNTFGTFHLFNMVFHYSSYT